MKKIILTILVFTLTSCVRFILVETNKLRKSMTPETVDSIIYNRPEKEFTIKISSTPSVEYLMQIYEISVGNYDSLYLLVFSGNKLMYWGYPYEFNRHPDPLLNEIGKTAVAEYEKIK